MRNTGRRARHHGVRRHEGARRGGQAGPGDSRIFEMVPNYSVPLPGAPTPRPLPSNGLPCAATWSWMHRPWFPGWAPTH
jgi:hypothetical protein